MSHDNQSGFGMECYAAYRVALVVMRKVYFLNDFVKGQIKELQDVILLHANKEVSLGDTLLVWLQLVNKLY